MKTYEQDCCCDLAAETRHGLMFQRARTAASSSVPICQHYCLRESEVDGEAAGPKQFAIGDVCSISFSTGATTAFCISNMQTVLVLD
jgi:hypothetical protein